MGYPSEQYDLEIERVVKEIRKQKAKVVLLQLPDGLKPEAELIQKAIETNTNAEVMLWLGSCFGSCDIPLEVQSLGVDLIVQWGHPPWRIHKG